MKPVVTGPIQLPPYLVDGVSDSGVGFEKKFDILSFFWPGTPVLSDDRAKVPVCWTIEQGRLTWADFYDTVEEYVDDDEVLVDPSPRWGEKGSLIRRPRAIVFQHHPSSTKAPSYEACTRLRGELRNAGIFAGTLRSDTAGAPYTVVKWSLLHKEYVVITEATGDDYIVLDVDERQSIGGEVLFVVEENAVSATSITPYYDQSVPAVLSLVASHDLGILNRTQPSFARLEYYFIQAQSDLITAGAVNEMDAFVNLTPQRCVKYKQYPGQIFNAVNPSFEAATRDLMAEIRDFFRIG